MTSPSARSSRRFASRRCAVLAAVILGATLPAADYEWYGADALPGGDNTWNTSSTYWLDSAGRRLRWRNDPVAGDRAIFAGTVDAPFVVTIGRNTAINANALWFRNNYTLEAGGSQSALNFVGVAPTLLVDPGVIATTEVSIRGASVTLTGGGTWALGGDNQLANSLGLIVQEGSTFNLGTHSETVGDVKLIAGALAGTGTLTTTGAFTVLSGTVDVRLAGAGRSLGKSGAGTVVLNGVNTYTGATTISEGTLRLGANERLANSSAVAVEGGTFALGAFSETVAKVTLAAGSITGTTGLLTGSEYDLRSGFVGARLGGTGRNLTKSTEGMVTLAGANSYTGRTALNAGTLVLTGSTARESAITVARGATFAGTGTTNGAPVTVDGILSPGAMTSAGLSAIGTLTTGAETWNAGGAYVWQVNSVPELGAAGSNWDRLVINGALALNAGIADADRFTLHLVGLGGDGLPGAIAGFDNTQTYSWSLLTASSISGFNAAAFKIDASAFGATNALGGGAFSVARNGTSLDLTFTPVPEPAFYAGCLGVGSLGVAAIRRWRRRQLVHG